MTEIPSGPTEAGARMASGGICRWGSRPTLGGQGEGTSLIARRDSSERRHLGHAIETNARLMAAKGYGWEDICVQWNIRDPLARVLIKQMVLQRGPP